MIVTDNERPCWRHPRVLSAFLVVFVTGVFAGALTHSLLSHKSRAAASATLSREDAKKITLDRFTRELDLTAEQRDKLEVILDDFFQYYHSLQAQMDDVRANGKKRILALLDERQKKQFEKMMSEFQLRRLN
jgi:Spy/CpxP family protein refolding chaperone